MFIGNYDIFLEIILLTPFLLTEIGEEIEELTISSSTLLLCRQEKYEILELSTEGTKMMGSMILCTINIVSTINKKRIESIGTTIRLQYRTTLIMLIENVMFKVLSILVSIRRINLSKKFLHLRTLYYARGIFVKFTFKSSSILIDGIGIVISIREIGSRSIRVIIFMDIINFVTNNASLSMLLSIEHVSLAYREPTFAEILLNLILNVFYRYVLRYFFLNVVKKY